MSAKLTNVLWRLYLLRGYWQAVNVFSQETRIPYNQVIESLDSIIDSRYA